MGCFWVGGVLLNDKDNVENGLSVAPRALDCTDARSITLVTTSVHRLSRPTIYRLACSSATHNQLGDLIAERTKGNGHE